MIVLLSSRKHANLICLDENHYNVQCLCYRIYCTTQQNPLCIHTHVYMLYMCIRTCVYVRIHTCTRSVFGKCDKKFAPQDILSLSQVKASLDAQVHPIGVSYAYSACSVVWMRCMLLFVCMWKLCTLSVKYTHICRNLVYTVLADWLGICMRVHWHASENSL
jgi:hypothetical protein